MGHIRVGLRRRKFPLALAMGLLIFCFLTPGPKPLLALETEEAKVIGFTVGGVLLASVAAYVIWLSRAEGKVDWSPRGPGGFFIGGYAGGSFISDNTWEIKLGEKTVNRVIGVQPGAAVGGKLGYFCHKFPYLGIEGEFSYVRHEVNNQNIRFGSTKASFNDTFDNFSFVLHLLARYGFLPDKEVPFGRLQPYVGLGPGLEIVMGDDDTAKNLSLDVSAGLRYMWLKNFSTFVEYKFSHQFAVEINPKFFNLAGGGNGRGSYTFDYSRHMVVLGVAYHFL
jgi:opacity protein-like surface antigen